MYIIIIILGICKLPKNLKNLQQKNQLFLYYRKINIH